jgi:hypothetical protein
VAQQGHVPPCAIVDRSRIDQRLEWINIAEDDLVEYRTSAECFVGVCPTAAQDVLSDL